MSSCDHMIMTVGTFGWWAAWMTSQRSGDVLYYQHPFKEDSTLDSSFNIHDMFPSRWLAYNKTNIKMTSTIRKKYNEDRKTRTPIVQN